MSNALYNLAAMTVASSGTGTITLGSAATINSVGYLSFASAGVPDGQPVYYSILDPGSGLSEMGSGTYTAAGTTLTRSVIISNSTGGAASPINMSRNAVVLIAPPTSQYREVLTANRNYFTSSAGSDSNTGLSSGAAFLTITKAVNTVFNLDLSTFNATINLLAGTFSEAVAANGPWVGSGTVALQSTGGSSAVTWTTPGGTGIALTCRNGNAMTINGILFSSNSIHLRANAAGNITVGTSVNFGQATTYQLWCDQNGILSGGSSYTISGGAANAHIQSEGGEVTFAGIGVTLLSTPAIGAFIWASRNSLIQYFSNTFVGGATGQRYLVSENSVLYVNGASTTYLPGTTTGVSQSGGQYV